MLRPPGEHRPVVMRLGGESSDSSFWENDDSTIVAPQLPTGAPVLADSRMDEPPGSHREIGWTATHPRPQSGRTLTQDGRPGRRGGGERAARTQRDRLRGGQRARPLHPRVCRLDARQTARTRFLGSRFTIPKYISLFGAYVRAITRAVPGATMVGPSTTSADAGWISGLVASPQAKNISLITAHLYPLLNGCAVPGQRRYPCGHQVPEGVRWSGVQLVWHAASWRMPRRGD